MKKIRLNILIPMLILCLSAGAVGTFFTAFSVRGWYAALNKPFFNPPDWVFSLVWTALYLMMGMALYEIWITKSKKKYKSDGLRLFFLQLILNTGWSVIFFGWKMPLLALVEIMILWVMILFTILNFYPVKKSAAYLLIPYLVWVFFAIILNFMIVVGSRLDNVCYTSHYDCQ